MGLVVGRMPLAGVRLTEEDGLLRRKSCSAFLENLEMFGIFDPEKWTREVAQRLRFITRRQIFFPVTGDGAETVCAVMHATGSESPNKKDPRI